MVQEHNQQAAQMWSHGGRDYDFISFGISDALAHAAQRLWPRPGEKILDVATGTGWSARNLATLGAEVTGIDIADDLLEAARELSAHIDPGISYQHADAEALPFDDASFDAVVSTFGVMFAPNQEQAASELARVCKSKGRIVLTTWGPGDYAAHFFALVGKHSGAPRPEVSPLEWGRPERVETLLGEHFDLDCSMETTTFFAPDGKSIWGKFSVGFGPIRTLIDGLEKDALAAFRDDFIAFHEGYWSGNGLRIDREYLLTTGVRR